MSQIVTEVYDAFRAANVQEELAKAAAGAIAGREDLVTKLDLEHNVNRMQTEIVDVAWGAALLRRRPNQSLRQRGRRQLDPSRRGEGAAEGTGGRWYLCRQRRLGVFRWYSRAWWRVSVRINAPAARGGLRTVATAAKCHRAPVDYHPVAGQMPTGLQ